MMKICSMVSFFSILILNINSASINDLNNSIKNLGNNIITSKLNINDSEIILNSLKNHRLNPLNDNNEFKFSDSQCDLITEGPACIYEGDRVILPSARPKNLIGYWNFDEIKPIDNSGFKNHAAHTVQSGPSFGGIGYSAYFTEGKYLEVQHSNDFKSKDFTVSFWFYLMKDENNFSGTKICPLIQKGKDDLFNKTYNRFPSIYFDRKVRNFKVYMISNKEHIIQGENFTSNAKATYEKWVHISLIKKNKNLKFYFNGILDFQINLKREIEINTDNLFIGNVPWLSEICNYPFLIDELRYYNAAIDEDFIQAEASPVLGGIEPNFLQLGCLNCSLNDASKSCKEGYKLCSGIELNTGGYQISRAMGWLNWDSHIWTNTALENKQESQKLKGLGLCCVDIK